MRHTSLSCRAPDLSSWAACIKMISAFRPTRGLGRPSTSMRLQAGLRTGSLVVLQHSQRCRTALATTREIFTPVKDRKIDQGCGLNDVVRTDHSPIAFSPQTTATCGLTAALIWYQAALQDVALSQMHTRLIRVDQLGTSACRNVNSEAIGSRSQHATANAIDIAAFHFANGRTITVARDYGADTPEGGRASSALGGRYLHIFLTARTLPLRAFYQEMARP